MYIMHNVIGYTAGSQFVSYGVTDFSVLAACDIVEMSCPNNACIAQPAQVLNNITSIKCACNTDLCNNNITWTSESEEPLPTYSYSMGMIRIRLLSISYHLQPT